MSNWLRFPMPPMLAAAVASCVAAIMGMGGWSLAEGVSDPGLLLVMIFFGGWLTAFALALLAGAQILPTMVQWFGYRWWTLAATGVLAGVGPLLVAMLVGVMRGYSEGNIDLTMWIAPFEWAGFGGLVGGLLFWAIAEGPEAKR